MCIRDRGGTGADLVNQLILFAAVAFVNKNIGGIHIFPQVIGQSLIVLQSIWQIGIVLPQKSGIAFPIGLGDSLTVIDGQRPLIILEICLLYTSVKG